MRLHSVLITDEEDLNGNVSVLIHNGEIVFQARENRAHLEDMYFFRDLHDATDIAKIFIDLAKKLEPDEEITIIEHFIRPEDHYGSNIREFMKSQFNIEFIW